MTAHGMHAEGYGREECRFGLIVFGLCSFCEARWLRV